MLPTEYVQNALASAGLVHGLSLDDIHDRLRKGLALHDHGQRVLAFYLNEIDAGRLYTLTGHPNTVSFAEKRLELDRRRTGELLAVGRKLLTLPEIDTAFCKRELSWSKLRMLMAVASPEHEAAWLTLAQSLKCRELQLEIRRAVPGGPPPKPGERKGLPEVRFPVEGQVGVLTQQKIELAKKKLAAEFGRALNFDEFMGALVDLALATEPDGSIPGRKQVPASLYTVVLHEEEGTGQLLVDGEDGLVPLPNYEALLCDARFVHLHDEEGARSGPVGHGGGCGTGGHEHGELDPPTPPWLREKVLARDGRRCRSCGSRHGLMVHHIQWRSKKGPTTTWNLISECSFCHALIHAGLLVLVGERADEIRFVDACGIPVNESDLKSGRLAPFAVAPPESHLAPEEARLPAFSRLEAVPEVVDGLWWQRHAHLIRFGGRGSGDQGLEFREGEPLPEAEPKGGEAQGNEDVAAASSGLPAFDPAAMREAFSGIVGQPLLLDRLEIEARGSDALGRPFPHTLLTGPAGTGKTSIAQALAAAAGRRLVKATGPLLGDVGQLVRILAQVRAGDVLFLEEVHAVPQLVLEALYEAMAERRLSFTLHAGSRARAVRLDLPAFTVVAATTEEGTLPAPFLSRFGLREALAPYAVDVLAEMVKGRARTEGFDLEDGAAERVAAFARGTPREALRLLDRVLAAAASEGQVKVAEQAAAQHLVRLGYDAQGLQPLERRYLAALRESRTPLSLMRIAHLLGACVRTLLRDVEPFLFRLGLIEITPRGRIALREPSPRAAYGA